jgi:LDH2 family malate/lactate/ureidoglycolate dehydrogenase
METTMNDQPLIRLMQEAPKADGQERIYIPGEKEFEIAERRRKEGVPVHPKVVETLREIGAEPGVDCSVLKAAEDGSPEKRATGRQ